MAIFGRTSPPIQIGDRFRKADDRFGAVWEVVRLWATVDGLLHARLKAGSETRIISAITLADTDFFSPVPTLPTEE